MEAFQEVEDLLPAEADIVFRQKYNTGQTGVHKKEYIIDKIKIHFSLCFFKNIIKKQIIHLTVDKKAIKLVNVAKELS